MVLPGPVARINGGGSAKEHATGTAAEVSDGRTLARPPLARPPPETVASSRGRLVLLLLLVVLAPLPLLLLPLLLLSLDEEPGETMSIWREVVTI